MKKKYLNKSIVALLLTVFLIIIVSTLYTGFVAVYADSQYTQDYTQLTDEELDDLSARTTESDEAPQITVFTHGFGGGAQHWANDISEGGNGNFAYESDSMIEQLRESIKAKAEDKDNAVTMFVVRIGEGNVYTEESDVTSSQSSILNTALTDNIGSEQLRCIYNDNKYITDKQLLLYRNDNRVYNIDNTYNEYTHLSSDDVSKHIILVFNAEESERSNDYVYAQFTNTSSTTITVAYNQKMCFLGDAQKWTGLDDLIYFNLDPGEAEILDGEDVIKENWFATSVAFSYEANNYRYITYADGLYDDGSINVKYNRVLA